MSQFVIYQPGADFYFRGTPTAPQTTKRLDEAQKFTREEGRQYLNTLRAQGQRLTHYPKPGWEYFYDPFTAYLVPVDEAEPLLSEFFEMGSRASLGMNIPDSLWNYAMKLNAGFDWEATGGGTDYIVRNLGKNKDRSDRLVLLSAEGGASPDRLNEKSWLIITLNKHWRDTVVIPVATAKQGLEMMAQMETVLSG